MKIPARRAAARRWAVAAMLFAISMGGVCRAQSAVALPSGVKAVWDLGQAYREATPTRERISINGLWRWQPAAEAAAAPPAGDWGYFKVPGFWPGREGWQMDDSQTCFVNPAWKSVKLGDINAAWYQREITLPSDWAGRRISLSAEYVNSVAVVYLDGNKAGEMRFPGGAVDLTAQCRPGGTHTLSLLVTALPLKEILALTYDTVAGKKSQDEVERRGLCGDVWLIGEPAGPRLADVKVDTSVRKWEISFETGVQGLAANEQYWLKAEVSDQGRSAGEFASKPFTAADVKDGRIAFTASWKPEKLWDTNTPQNMYQVRLSLLDSGGKVLDAALPARFGFREFWIDGRDFYLNGSRIFLFGVPMGMAEMGAAAADYDGAREAFLRMKSFGVNYAFCANYGCEPGTHVSFAEILRAADDVGMLVGFSQPNFNQYDWSAPNADQENGYARHAEYYVRAAENHPSVVMYVMSHNAVSYVKATDPEVIDGIQNPRKQWWETVPAAKALRAQAIVRRLDPAHVIYHHFGGNLGEVYTLNFYPNFVPIQELDDWFEHWAAVGVKPVFLVEFAASMSWDFGMYRGWYDGKRAWGDEPAPWELCIEQWNSQFFGDAAFRIDRVTQEVVRWESAKFRAGATWYHWDYPGQMGTVEYADQFPVMNLYITDNWRAFRTWGLSGFNQWEWSNFWKLRPGTYQGIKKLPVDWDQLQRPGLSPDFVDWRHDSDMVTANERTDWIPTPAAEALLRNNMPLLAYIGGKPEAFTSKDHNFLPGETLVKQLIIINNSREPVTCDCTWSLSLPQPLSGAKQTVVQTGQQERIPLSFDLPADLPPGRYELSAAVKFSSGESQQDTFSINVLPPAKSASFSNTMALFDPKGETAKLLAGMGILCAPVDAQADLSKYDVLIIGKGALTADGPAPDLARVRDGLHVIVFEQTSEALEKRLGFRVEEEGIRRAFERIPGHPLLAGLDAENLHDWRGEATIMPPTLKLQIGPDYEQRDPYTQWCGLDSPHIWRCGCRGNVASVLIEKPARGDFLPILDCGYSLQFSPLMEYREGRGMILFCQMDVTGRTEDDPAAKSLAANILRYVSGWQPAPHRDALYVGDPSGKSHLERAGITLKSYDGGALSAGQVLIVGTDGGKELAPHAADIAGFLKRGGNVLALGLDGQEASSFLPAPVGTTKREHISTFFEPFSADSLLEGVGPADVDDHSVRKLPLVSSGATAFGDGILAKAQDANVVFCQFVPYQLTRAEGAPASFVVDSSDAAEGKRSALVTVGTSARSSFGQTVTAAPQVGATYTFAALLKGVGGPVTVSLHVLRNRAPYDLVAKSAATVLTENQWTDAHVTFTCDKPSPEGLQVVVDCGQDGARYRAGLFRLCEGDYLPWKPSAEAQPAPQNLLANPSFAKGEKPYWFHAAEEYNLRRSYRRGCFLLTRLLAEMGVAGSTPLLERFGSPVQPGESQKRWDGGLYLDQPEVWDDVYRSGGW